MSNRILFVLDDFIGPFAGTEAQFWLLHQGLVARTGRVPQIVTLRPSAYLEKNLPGAYRCLNVTSLGSPRTWWAALKLAREAHRAGVRVAHLFLNDVSVLMPLPFWLFGIKTIISRRDLGFWYTRGLLKALRWVRPFVSAAVANCQAVKEVTLKEEGFAPSKVRVLLNGYQAPSKVVPRDLRRELNLPVGALILGMVANLRPLKRVADAIDAVAKLHAQGVAAELVIAGADVMVEGVSQQAALTQLARLLGVDKHVHFLGSVQESWSLLAGLDIFLSCSETEGLSNSIIEAMASGLPVVATAVGGTPEIVSHGRTGLLYEAGNRAELTQTLRSIATDSRARVRLGRAAQRFALTHLSEDTLINEHEKLYRDVGSITLPARLKS